MERIWKRGKTHKTLSNCHNHFPRTNPGVVCHVKGWVIFDDVVHCFERFRGDPIEAWCITFLQLVDGSFDFSKTDGIVNHLHAWFLSEEVDRSQTMII